jgi:hypothetical protein
MTDDGSVLPHPRSFIRDNLIWILGLVPFALAAIKILLVSGADSEVLRYLVQDLNVVALVLSTTLPLLPILVFWVCIGWLEWRKTLAPDIRAALGWINYPAYIFIGPILLTMRLIDFIVNVVLLITFLIARPLMYRRRERRFGADQAGRGPPIRLATPEAVFALFLSYLITATVTWIPAEIISVKGEDPIAGYVLSSNDQWTTFYAGRGQIHIVRTTEVGSRAACEELTSVFFKPLANAIFAPNQNQRPPCPQ